MGKVRDIYIKYEEGGDQFCGRCLSMLPLLQPEFGVSPPHFSPQCPRMWINTTITTTFPMIVAIVSQRRLLEFCLAQLVYHKVYIESWDENYVIRTSCQLFRDNELTAVGRDHAIVLYLWTEGVGVYSFTGIPAHVAVLHEIRAVAERQRNIVDQLLERLVETLDQRGIAGGVMSEQRLRDIVIHATQDIRDRMTNIAASQGIGPELAAAQARSQAPPRSYSTHMHGGKIHLLPEPWRFPSVGVLLLWQHWLLGTILRTCHHSE